MASVDEIWLVDFGDPFPGEPAHQRPALVVGPPEHFGASFPYRIVLPMTSTRRDLPIHVEVEASAGSGLDSASYVQCELVRSVSSRRLVHQLGTVSRSESDRVGEILRTLLPTTVAP
jgi:mRNA interferase MazF